MRGSLLFAAALALPLLSACAGPPVQEMSNARQAVIAAQRAGAARYAPTPYAQAERWLDDAEFALRGDDFDRARSSARHALDAAREAVRRACAQRAEEPPRAPVSGSAATPTGGGNGPFTGPC